MDYGISKHPEQLAKVLEPYLPGVTPKEALEAVVRGRNNWIVWTAGNDRLWDQLSRQSFGNLDLLKTISNHPSLKFSRDNRWEYLGLVNEPCFDKGPGPRKDRYGLWLDVRDSECAPDPFENEEKYPGVKIGARGKNLPAGSYYGYATGIVGLRLFPNPKFDAAAEKRWDAEKYYTDPSYFNDEELVRPYRIGMSCGFCHVGPNPTNPPKDPENPEWANLNSNPGAQYFWWDRAFTYQSDPTSFPYQLFHTSRPGALDTSLVSTDYINNPRTMNAIYQLGPRLLNGLRLAKEKLAGGSLDNAQLDKRVPKDSILNDFYEAPATVYTPRVLKDGADSVGALGALNRVFVNIGLFSEDWTTHFNPLVGGKTITPFTIKNARKNSSYWVATEKQTFDTAVFFLTATRPDYLKNAPGGREFLTEDAAKLKLGKEMFADRCARCHSSKLPKRSYDFFPNKGCVGRGYLKCWNDFWAWSKTKEFKSEMREIVLSDSFLEDNFLSTELRVPVTLLETNACSPLATNAIAGNIWDNFSSQSYKNLPSVGRITVHHPITAEAYTYEMPGGGRGYTRPASLVSVWSTAPYLLNNTLGDFYWTGSVEDRIKSFESGMRELLWPQERKGNRTIVTASGKKGPGLVDETTETSYLRLPEGFLPKFLRTKLAHKLLPKLFGDDGGLQLGPIPKGTPVNLISNINLDPSRRSKLVPLVLKLIEAFERIPKDASDEEALKVYEDEDLVSSLLAASKCPDFVVNRGHYFGTEFFSEEPGLSDEEKLALIEFLKTL